MMYQQQFMLKDIHKMDNQTDIQLNQRNDLIKQLEDHKKKFKSEIQKLTEQIWKKYDKSIISLEKIFQQKIASQQKAIQVLTAQNQKMRQCFSCISTATNSTNVFLKKKDKKSPHSQKIQVEEPLQKQQSQQDILEQNSQSEKQIIIEKQPPISKQFLLQKSLIHQVSFKTINGKQISNIQYILPSYKTKFTIQRIKTNFKGDLSMLQSVDIHDLKIDDQAFEFFTKLEMKNLRSLYIYSNFINDITHLKNLNLNQFIELDITWNPLEKKSIDFMANQHFPQLMAIQMSFKSGLNEAAWKVFLSKKQFLFNMPKLQQLFIYNSKQLSQQTQKEITRQVQEKEKKSGLKFKLEFKKITLSKFKKTSLKNLEKQNQKWRKQASFKAEHYFNIEEKKKGNKKTKKIKKNKIDKKVNVSKIKSNQAMKLQENEEKEDSAEEEQIMIAKQQLIEQISNSQSKEKIKVESEDQQCFPEIKQSQDEQQQNIMCNNTEYERQQE